MKLILFKNDLRMYWIGTILIAFGMVFVALSELFNISIYAGYFIMAIGNYFIVIQEAKKNNLAMAIFLAIFGKFTYFLWPIGLATKRIYDKKIMVRNPGQNKKIYLLSISLFILIFTIPPMFKFLLDGLQADVMNIDAAKNIIAGFYLASIPATVVAIARAKDKGSLALLDVVFGVITLCVYTVVISILEIKKTRKENKEAQKVTNKRVHKKNKK